MAGAIQELMPVQSSRSYTDTQADPIVAQFHTSSTRTHARTHARTHQPTNQHTHTVSYGRVS